MVEGMKGVIIENHRKLLFREKIFEERRILFRKILSFAIIVLFIGTSIPPNILIENARADPTDTIYVPDDYPSIQSAVENSSNGDTIIVRDGTYIENVNVIRII